MTMEEIEKQNNVLLTLFMNAKEAFQFIDLALQYEDQDHILRSGVRMAEVRAKAHVLFTEIKRLESK